MDNRTLIVSALLLVVAGCSVPVTPACVGGSRADGSVLMAYQYGALVKPQVDWSATQADARVHCAAWGYNDAQPFGGASTQCVEANQYGCIVYKTTVPYQCQTSATP